MESRELASCESFCVHFIEPAPDGDRIAIGTLGADSMSIHQLSTGESTALTTGYPLVFSPDSDRLLCKELFDPLSAARIVTLADGTTVPADLGVPDDNRGATVRWDPTGLRALYISSDRKQLFLRDVGLGTSTRIWQHADTLESEIAAAIAGDHETARLAALLQTIHGIGPITAATLIADLPELGLLSAKQIAALLGLAPHTRRSGTMRYREPTGHGRAGLRQALFNAARAAIRHPSPFKAFYDRLVRQNRRPGKVALTAVMRKLLITANAVARDRQPWHGLRQTMPPPAAVGTPGRPHGAPRAHRAGRVKAIAAPGAVARRASLDAA